MPQVTKCRPRRVSSRHISPSATSAQPWLAITVASFGVLGWLQAAHHLLCPRQHDATTAPGTLHPAKSPLPSAGSPLPGSGSPVCRVPDGAAGPALNPPSSPTHSFCPFLSPQVPTPPGEFLSTGIDLPTLHQRRAAQVVQPVCASATTGKAAAHAGTEGLAGPFVRPFSPTRPFRPTWHAELQSPIFWWKCHALSLQQLSIGSGISKVNPH